MKWAALIKYKKIYGFKFLIGFIIFSITFVNLKLIQDAKKVINKQNTQIAPSDHTIPNSNYYSNYTLSPRQHPNNFGAFITEIDICNLNLNNPTPLISQLIKDIYKYKFVILKNQCSEYNYEIPPDILEHFGSQFGATSQYRGKGATDPEGTNITVLSNDQTIGIVGFGARPWHVDGLWDIAPKSFCLQHIIKLSNIGGQTELTDTVALLKLFAQKDIEFYNELHKLYVVYYSTLIQSQIVYPLIAIQPFTNEKYMIWNSKLQPPNMRQIIKVNNKSFIDELHAKYIGNVKVVTFKGKAHYRGDSRITFYRPKQIDNLINKIDMFIDNEGKQNGIYYVTDYEKGDLLIRDNLLLFHRGDATTTLPVDHVGLRILWRLCINGKEYPTAAMGL